MPHVFHITTDRINASGRKVTDNDYYDVSQLPQELLEAIDSTYESSRDYEEVLFGDLKKVEQEQRWYGSLCGYRNNALFLARWRGELPVDAEILKTYRLTMIKETD